jgi:hypothetical protein
MFTAARVHCATARVGRVNQGRDPNGEAASSAPPTARMCESQRVELSATPSSRRSPKAHWPKDAISSDFARPARMRQQRYNAALVSAMKPKARRRAQYISHGH